MIVIRCWRWEMFCNLFIISQDFSGLMGLWASQMFMKNFSSSYPWLPIPFHGSNILLVCIRTTLFPWSSDPSWPFFFFFSLKKKKPLVDVEAGGGWIGRHSLFPTEIRLMLNLFTQRAGLCQKEVLGLFHKYSLLLPAARATRESFFHFHFENLRWIPGGKGHKSVRPS